MRNYFRSEVFGLFVSVLLVLSGFVLCLCEAPGLSSATVEGQAGTASFKVTLNNVNPGMFSIVLAAAVAIIFFWRRMAVTPPQNPPSGKLSLGQAQNPTTHTPIRNGKKGNKGRGGAASALWSMLDPRPGAEDESIYETFRERTAYDMLEFFGIYISVSRVLRLEVRVLCKSFSESNQFSDAERDLWPALADKPRLSRIQPIPFGYDTLERLGFHQNSECKFDGPQATEDVFERKDGATTLTFDYDATGRMNSRQSSEHKYGWPLRRKSLRYGYDRRGNLQAVSHSAPALPSNLASETTTYDYDGRGHANSALDLEFNPLFPIATKVTGFN
jgi:hypothetical protein